MKKTILAGLACFTIILSLTAGLMIPSIPDRLAIFEGSDTPDTALYTFSPAGGGTLGGTAVGRQQYEAKLFGLIPVKSVSVDILPETMLVPCGRAYGVKMFTQGVMVVGMSEIETSEGFIAPASQAGIKTGDIILESGGKKIDSIESLTGLFAQAGGRQVELTIERDGESFNVSVTPAKASLDGAYKVGMWVRDSTAGIGTITFYDPAKGMFAGLGHGIFDVDTGALMPLGSGSIIPAEIIDVRKGEKGSPGELRGTFGDDDCGSLIVNSHAGIYGAMTDMDSFPEGKPIPAASYSDISEGRATILSNIDGDKVEEFQIEITKIYKNSGYSVKNMIIKITDQRLIDKTGGIVQGMSGSPIIQKGRLVGAVTHVLVNDPTKGYAIFIENMLAEMNDAA